MFDRFIMVDWSASGRPKGGKDSIWIGDLVINGGDCLTTNARTRREAESVVHVRLQDVVGKSQRVLIGFDFPYGYPRGFGEALGLRPPLWSAIWHRLADGIEDSDKNRNNRFAVASAINAELRADVFWGCPTGQTYARLSTKSPRDVPYDRVGTALWRRVEDTLRERGNAPHSVWQLLGAGAVGSQTLTGIPVLQRLRTDAVLAPVSRVWPFEVDVPRLDPGSPAVIHAEIWPGIFPYKHLVGECADEKQVIAAATALRDRDESGTLGDLFRAALPEAQVEGWILGVT